MFLPAHERLFRALLFEMASGNYRPNRRFLSHRLIMRNWRVSATTANRALELLCTHGLVHVSERSGHYLAGGYRERALTLLADAAIEPEITPIVSRRDLRQRLIADKSAMPAGLMHIGVLLLTPFAIPRNTPRTPEQMNLDVAAALTARGIYVQAEANRNRIDFLASNGTESDLKRAFQRLSRTAPDGVVIVCRIADLPIGKLAEALLQQLIPVVVIFDDCEGTEMIGVNFNHVGMGLKAAEIFLEAGHERVGVLCPSQPSKNTGDRALGFEHRIGRAAEAEKRRSRPCVQRFTIDQNATPHEAERIAQAVVESKITALFCIGHELLQALLPSLQACGLCHPEKLSLLSCSAHPEVNGAPGRVNILYMDFEALGRIACRALLDYRRGEVSQKYYLVNTPYHSYNSIQMRHPL